MDLLGEASNAMDTAAQLDESLSGVSGTLMDLYYSAKDAAAELIDRLDAYDTNDAELDEIEQRLDLLYRLKRKYGDTVEDIIAFDRKHGRNWNRSSSRSSGTISCRRKSCACMVWRAKRRRP